VTRRRAISLRFELGVLSNAVLAARMLVDVARYHYAGDEHDQRRATDAAAAVLELVAARARLLDRTLSRTQDPALLAEHFNEVSGSAADLRAIEADDLLLHVQPRPGVGPKT